MVNQLVQDLLEIGFGLHGGMLWVRVKPLEPGLARGGGLCHKKYAKICYLVCYTIIYHNSEALVPKP